MVVLVKIINKNYISKIKDKVKLITKWKDPILVLNLDQIPNLGYKILRFLFYKDNYNNLTHKEI